MAAFPHRARVKHSGRSHTLPELHCEAFYGIVSARILAIGSQLSRFFVRVPIRAFYGRFLEGSDTGMANRGPDRARNTIPEMIHKGRISRSSPHYPMEPDRGMTVIIRVFLPARFSAGPGWPALRQCNKSTGAALLEEVQQSVL